jgi:hypothetical protein
LVSNCEIERSRKVVRFSIDDQLGNVDIKGPFEKAATESEEIEISF